jgi:hypothetical protein
MSTLTRATSAATRPYLHPLGVTAAQAPDTAMPPRGQHPRTLRADQLTHLQLPLDVSGVHPYRDQRGLRAHEHGPPDTRCNESERAVAYQDMVTVPPYYGEINPNESTDLSP